jgi:anti-sigma factor RsiW
VQLLVSVSLDSELCEFERAMLRAHLGSCPSCTEHARHAAALTGMLREAPLEPLPFRVSIPQRRRGSQSMIRAGVAVAAVIAAIGIGLGSTLFPTSSTARSSLHPGYPFSFVRQSQIDDRENWAGGLPRVTPAELPLPLGQRQVATDA